MTLRSVLHCLLHCPSNALSCVRRGTAVFGRDRIGVGVEGVVGVNGGTVRVKGDVGVTGVVGIRNGVGGGVRYIALSLFPLTRQRRRVCNALYRTRIPCSCLNSTFSNVMMNQIIVMEI